MALPEKTYGFIGIGVMGWGMAKNLRAKMPTTSKMLLCELSQERRDQFVAETVGLIEVAANPREVAECSVSQLLFVH